MSFIQQAIAAGRVLVRCRSCGEPHQFVRGDDVAITRWKRAHKCSRPEEETG